MKIKEIQERELNTYAEVWRVSYWTLDQAIKEFEGSYFQIISSIIFTAFTFEAYLNHIGRKLFSCWDDLERLSPKSKLNFIAEKLELKIDYSKRPFQTLTRLIEFRNDVAHGKSLILKSEKTIITDGLDYLNEKDNYLKAEWEKFCTLDNAKRTREDIEIIIRQIHTAGNFKERLFFTGLRSKSGSIIKEV